MMTKRHYPHLLRHACIALGFCISQGTLANDILLPSPSPAPTAVPASVSPSSAPATTPAQPHSKPASQNSAYSTLGNMLGHAFGNRSATPAASHGSSQSGTVAGSKPEDKLGDLIAEKTANEASSGGNPVTSKLQNITHHATELVMQAMGMLGIHYKRGGSTPDSGLDCSGMVRYVFKQALGRELPRSAIEISQVGKNIQTSELQPGDLVFYNTMRRAFSHVGIYLGDNKFIHSPSVGGQVRIESMDLAYWKQRFNGARRMEN